MGSNKIFKMDFGNAIELSFSIIKKKSNKSR